MFQKYKLPILAGIGLFIVVAWFVTSSFVTKRAEQKLYSFLAKHSLVDHVRWGDLSVSIFGTLVLKDVSVSLGMGEPALNVEKIKVSDFTDSADRQLIVASFDKISDGNGMSPLRAFGIVRATGLRDLPPASLSLTWDLDFDDNDGEIRINVEQPMLMSVEGKVNVDTRGGIREAARMLGDLGLSSVSGLGGRGLAPNLQLGLFGGLQTALFGLRIVDLDVTLEDKGHFERVLILTSRYGEIFPNDVKNGSEGFRKNELQKMIKSKIDECKTPEGSRGFAYTANPQRSCRAMTSFSGAQEDRLNIKAKPRQPVAFSEIIGSYAMLSWFKFVEAPALRALNLSIEN